MDVDDLRGLFVFDGLSDDRLADLLAAGQEIHFEAGTELFHEGDPAAFWWVLVDGSIDLVRQAGREDPVVLRTVDRPGVWAGGFQAWAEDSGYMATVRGVTAGRMLRVPSEQLGALARAWFPFGVHLIEGFFQTVRTMDSLSRQRESLIALGTLAAGLAHEINNPASATVRAVDALQETCELLLSSLVQLAERALPAERFVAIEAARREIDAGSGAIDPLAVADAEEALFDWLDAHEVADSWRIAPPLAAAGVGPAWCEQIATITSAPTLGPALEWVAGTLATRALLIEMRDSTTRITSLVEAVKAYSQLDRASVQLIDVTEGIESTLVMLSHDIGEGITVVRDYDQGAPRLEGFAGELNQVWTNLIDNAVDAMEGTGTLRISTHVDEDDLVVGFADTGPGMPVEVQARAFEPFFTTKEVGKGTGLGLDISRRIVVDRHHGRIDIKATPAGTTLSVRLPLRRTRGPETSPKP